MDQQTPAPVALGPIAAQERHASLDVLRGFAVLGILAMNITFFALPTASYNNPAAFGGATGLNLAAWVFAHVIFEVKFMTIFSALFGAGLVVMHQRAEASGRGLGAIYYRRVLWLLAIGLVHAYAIWAGDILMTYALCGLLIFLFRRRSPRTLMIIGSCAILIPAFVSVGFGSYVQKMKQADGEVAALEAAQETPSAEQEKLAEMWREMRPYFEPTAQEIQEELAVYRDGYAGMVKHRAPLAFMSQTMAVIFFTLWRAGGVMLLGMALMKLGVFSASRSPGFYRRCMAWGYGVGLPLAALSAWDLIRVQWAMPHAIKISSHLNYFGSLAVALGHVGLVMLACQSDALPGLRRRLAAVGRLAFSNYIFQSLVCTTIFYGYGLGLFGRLERAPLLLVTVAVWLTELWISPWWLARFRYGPLEWLWRSLTYKRRQPMALGGQEG